MAIQPPLEIAEGRVPQWKVIERGIGCVAGIAICLAPGLAGRVLISQVKAGRLKLVSQRISRRTLGDNHLTTLTLANNLAYELGELDRLTEAEALLDQTIANAQQWRTQAVKPSVYITAMSRLGRLRLLLKRYPESYQAYGQAVLAVRQRYGDSRASGDADRALTEQNDQSGVFVGQVQAGWAWAHGSSN